MWAYSCRRSTRRSSISMPARQLRASGTHHVGFRVVGAQGGSKRGQLEVLAHRSPRSQRERDRRRGERDTEFPFPISLKARLPLDKATQSFLCGAIGFFPTLAAGKKALVCWLFTPKIPMGGSAADGPPRWPSRFSLRNGGGSRSTPKRGAGKPRDVACNRRPRS